jgi:hypothetical protein
VADYNPATFEDDKLFSNFISNVDAFIISQAQLQAKADDDDSQEEHEHHRRNRDRDEDSAPEKPSAPAAGKDEWDF